nr:hypothetical protein [Legionella jordanis]
MKISNEMYNLLQEEKKARIIEAYLKHRFPEGFDEAWMTQPELYRELANILDYLFNLEDDKLSLAAIGSENAGTRMEYQKNFEALSNLLDSLVEFSKDNPPVALPVNKKEFHLQLIAVKQLTGKLSLRALHAQAANLGIAEKFLNAELGQAEWLADVDLERALNKLGIRDRVHITRLNAEDIGMILHFERLKHADSDQPYSIPLLINCGSSGSIRSQGTHWTQAIITVNPASAKIEINYRDSMTAGEDVAFILKSAINYDEISHVNGSTKRYIAFPDVQESDLTLNIVSEHSQEDGWSCGYRALYNLVNDENFPISGISNGATPLTAISNALYSSASLRNAMYRLLLENLEISEDFFEAMQLDKEGFKESKDGRSYGLDERFTSHYLHFLAEGHSARAITSKEFEENYHSLIANFERIHFETKRTKSLESLRKKIASISSDAKLSPDAKIFTLLDALAGEWNNIIISRHGEGSKLAKAIFDFCDNQFGVKLLKGPNYQVKQDGLIFRMFSHMMGSALSKEDTNSLLPKAKSSTTAAGKISHSAPVLGSEKVRSAKISPSADSIDKHAAPGQMALLKKQDLSRLGTMFGLTQFCYGEKVGGVEPGFRAIDLDEAFFEQLVQMPLPNSDKQALAAAFNSLLGLIAKADGLKAKQIAFASFINTHVPRPHAKNAVDPNIIVLCEQIKGAVRENNNLSAWLYKMDYAESGARKDRKKVNVEALREFVGTRMAGIFSEQNQKQEIRWLKGPKGPHAILACGWKNDLRELKEFLHGGHAPDWNGVLVEDPKASLKRSKHIPGLAKNLIFGIAIGDRDGIGKEAQNKGYASKAYYGFDYGKTYDGDGVCDSLQDDFSFHNPGSGAPGFLRSEGGLGVARHLMYRNYSIFYDTELADRMMGVHIWKKMVTGENPSEDVLKSYPGLRQELYRIQERIPTAEILLQRVAPIRGQCEEGSPFQQQLDKLAIEFSAGKLSPYELFFAEIKLDLISQSLSSEMPYEELHEYLLLLDNWTQKAAENNKKILDVFAQRLTLSRQEVNFLDKLEKIIAPCSILSHDGEAILNHLRISNPKERTPFQLSRQQDGSYILTTTNKSIQTLLRDRLYLDSQETKEGLRCTMTEKQLAQLMKEVDKQYLHKKEMLLNKAVFDLETLPRLKETYPTQTLHYFKQLLNHEIPKSKQIDLRYSWLENSSLSLLLTLKTEKQAKLLQNIFQLSSRPPLNSSLTLNITVDKLQRCAQLIEEFHGQMEKRQLDHNPKKWEKFKHEVELKEYQEACDLLIKRFTDFGTLDRRTLAQLEEAIREMSLEDLETLAGYNDNTLKDKNNILLILNDSIGEIVGLEQKVELQALHGTTDLGQMIFK